MRKRKVEIARYRGRRGVGKERLQWVLAGLLALAGVVLIAVRAWGMRFSGFLLVGLAALVHLLDLGVLELDCSLLLVEFGLLVEHFLLGFGLLERGGVLGGGRNASCGTRDASEDGTER